MIEGFSRCVAVLTPVAITSEHTAAAQRSMTLIRHRHVSSQPHHRRFIETEPLGAHLATAAGEKLDLLSQNETNRSPNSHNCERLEGRVENEHSSHGAKLAVSSTMVLGLAPSEPRNKIARCHWGIGVAVLGDSSKTQ